MATMTDTFAQFRSVIPSQFHSLLDREFVPFDQIVDVTRVGSDSSQFIGKGDDYGPIRLYGGHLLGQGLNAAYGTAREDMAAHSLHCYFLASGEPGQDITYDVETLRDGRRYAMRSVTARQGDRKLMTMMASFKVDEPGDEHQPDMPDAPDINDLIRARKEKGGMPFMLPITLFGVDVEPVDDWNPIITDNGAAEIRQWMRGRYTPGADARIRRCIMAYLSDGSMMFNALRPYGNIVQTHRATSLDHAVWFHDDSDPNEWHLFDQMSPAARDSRGLNHGYIYAPDGRLVASTTQESMLQRM